MYNNFEAQVQAECVMVLAELVQKLVQNQSFYNSNNLCKLILKKILDKITSEVYDQTDTLSAKISI